MPNDQLNPTPSTQAGNPDHQPKIPEQLRKQMVDVDAMYANGAASPQDEGASAGAAPEGAAAAVSPPAEGQPPATPPPAEDDQTWEQRFRSQQGRFDQMLRANQSLSERVTELQSSIHAMQAAGLQPPSATPEAEPERPRYVKDEEIEEYGDDFIDVVGRRAQEVYAPEMEQLASRLARIENQVQGVGKVVETTQKMGLYDTLAAQVPEWRTINRSDAFKAWLAVPDPYSGQARLQLLQNAFTGHETARVVAFFKGFLSEAAGLPQNSQARTPSAPPLPGNGNGSGKPSLEDFAAPGRARSAPQNLPPEKPIYTQAWIAKFYADKLAGKYRGRDGEVAATEADIFQAQHEGRIQ